MAARWMGRILAVAASLAVIAGAFVPPAAAVDRSINLDQQSGNGAESLLSVNVVTTSPVKIKDKVTNKAVGQSFRFSWPGAGPGGFSSQVAAGTSKGVGAIWTWETLQQVYDITGSINFTRIDQPANLTFNSVPGRSLSSSGVTTSNASLTASLITFFSPPQELVRVTSSVEQLGYGLNRYTYVVTNFTGDEVNFNWAPGPLACDTSYCGNDVRQGEEACDGPDLGGTTCEDLGFEGGILGCTNECGYDTSACTGSLCGNGAIDEGEQCDGENFGDVTCADYGYDAGYLTCSDGCTIGTANCYDLPYCGDGIVNRDAEQCDGTDLAGADCASQGCPYGGTLGCNLDCQYDISSCGCIGLGAATQGMSISDQPASKQPLAQARRASAKRAPAAPPHRARTAAATLGEIPIPCEFPGSSGKVDGNTSDQVFCRISPHPAKEVSSSLLVCGNSIPQGPPGCGSGLGSEGTANVLVPDDTITIGGIYLSTYLIEVADGSNGRAEPGETTDLFVWLLNAGNQGLIGAGTNPVLGHLEVVPGDYDGDGTNDPILPVITQADSTYPDIPPAAEVTGDCDTVQDQLQPVRNLTAFRVQWPASPTDVAYLFRVVVTGQPFGFTPAPTFPVPFVVGVGSACNESNVTGEFDGLQGLLPPMGPLVPADNDTPIPASISTESPTRPLKMKIFCGSKQLTGKDGIAAPEIIRLVRDGADVDLAKLYLDVNSNANDHSLLFRYSSGGSAWIYNLNTNAIGPGAYTLYIKMPNGQPYKTSFSIR